MLYLINRLIKEYQKIYLYVFVSGFLLRGLSLFFKDENIVQAVYGIWIMITSTFLVVLSTYYLYEFLYTRNKYFFYTVKYSRMRVVLVIMMILMAFNFVYFFSYSDFNFWKSLQKLISLLVYFVSSTSLLYTYRVLSSKKAGLNIFLISIIFLVVAYPYYFYQVFSDKINNQFMIGVSANGTENLYTHILPITLFVEEAVYQELSIYTMGINLIIFVIFSLLLLSVKKLKINW